MRRVGGSSNHFVGGVLLLVLTDAMLCGVTLADPTWTVTQLTDNRTDDWWPAISGTNVVWAGRDGTDWEIYSNFAGQLTHAAGDAKTPDISGTNVVWVASEEGGLQVYSNFAGRLSDSTLSDNWDGSPAISGTNVVWSGYSEPYVTQIYSNFAGQLTHYTHDNGEPYTGGDRPDISGTNVVWEQYTGNWIDGHSEICSNFGGPWSGPYTYNLFPAVSGTNVIWISADIQGSTPVSTILCSNFAGQLSGPDVEFKRAAISGTNVVWMESDGQLHTNFGGTIPIGTNGAGDVAISGTTVVWDAWDDSDFHWHIYMATYDEAQVTPLPGAVLLGILGFGVAGLKLRRYA